MAAVALLSFACSALITAVVSATVGGAAGTFVGDAGNDIVVGSTGSDSMQGLGGGDYFRGAGGPDLLSGGDDDDALIGDDPSNPASSDVLNGGGDNDEIAGGPGVDVENGGPGNDIMGSVDFTRAGGANVIDSGGDTINGEGGNDVIVAGPGADAVRGGDGGDSLFGEGDGDEFTPGPGQDYVSGGSGTDSLNYLGTPSALTIDLAAGSVSGDGTDTVDEVEDAFGGQLADTITGGPGANNLDGSLGGDTIDGGPGADTIFGREGNDTIIDSQTSGAGDSIHGNDGDDDIDVQNGIVDTVDCGENANSSVDADFVLADPSDAVTNCEEVDTTPGGQSTLTVSVSGTGTGTVTGAGIACPGDCTETYASGTNVTLQASAGTGSTFAGWGGACSGTGACGPTVSGATEVSAGFGLNPAQPPPDDDPAKPPAGDTTPPETTIDSGPQGRLKSKSRTKSVRFTFGANEGGSSFECRMDGGGFSPCTSGQAFKVGRGSHTFAVLAVDAAGNRDASPATRAFKVVKKKRKKRK